MIEIGLGHYLTLGAIIFTVGVIGIFLNRKNIIVILMSIELILLAVNINLVAFSIYMNDLVGQIFTLFILTVAAAEAAIGLAIIVVYFRNSGTIRVEEIDKLKSQQCLDEIDVEAKSAGHGFADNAPCTHEAEQCTMPTKSDGRRQCTPHALRKVGNNKCTPSESRRCKTSVSIVI